MGWDGATNPPLPATAPARGPEATNKQTHAHCVCRNYLTVCRARCCRDTAVENYCCCYLLHGTPVLLELEYGARRRNVEYPHRPARVPGNEVPLLPRRLDADTLHGRGGTVAAAAAVGCRRRRRGGVRDAGGPVGGRGELVALGSRDEVPNPVGVRGSGGKETRVRVRRGRVGFVWWKDKDLT